MDFTTEKREQIWDFLIKELETFIHSAGDLKVSPGLDKNNIIRYVQKYHSADLVSPEEAVSHIIEGLKTYSVHTTHPMYFGLFNPRPAFAGVLADTITAVFNPQMAAWSHSPFAAETENYLIREMGTKFGYPVPVTDGNFTTGGQEANLTAVLCALNRCFPEYAADGVQSLNAKPLIYCSKESHHSIIKSAGITGLGINAVKSIETDNQHRMDPGILENQIKHDLKKGFRPFMIVSSMGTTGTGAIDPIREIFSISKAYNCWLHADAAYGGAAVLHDKYSHLLDGISNADSITFDAHKWLSVPMSAGMFITRQPGILHQTFRITADYMPKDAGNMDVVDPYAHSIQWSRRFIGLKVYLSLLLYGWKGWENLVEEQIRKGDFLKQKLLENGWKIFNDTPLPVVCFGKEIFESDEGSAGVIAQKIVASGKAWISVYRINGTNTLRACITNFQTTNEDIVKLVEILNYYSE